MTLTVCRKKDLISQGASGIVYRATLKETSFDYAVKISRMKMSEEERFSDDVLCMFREINLMSSFDHPSVLKFIGASPTDFEGNFFPTFVMELCVNKSLFDMIELDLHQNEILQRDLKPILHSLGRLFVP